MNDGTLETVDGRPALRSERPLAHPIERVWRAVSVPAELARWFPAAADWTPAAGELIEAGGMIGEVTEVEAPHRLAWTFAGDHYAIDLSEHDDGCLLVFTHVFDDRTVPRRPPPDGTSTSPAWSHTSPAVTSQKKRPTWCGTTSTSATPHPSRSTPNPDGASWPGLWAGQW